MRFQNAIIAICVFFSLCANSALAAYSQGVMAGSQSVVICSPKGAHQIILGANGEPVEVVHTCADCCLGLTLAVLPTEQFITIHLAIKNVVIVANQNAVELFQKPSKHARAPPVGL